MRGSLAAEKFATAAPETRRTPSTPARGTQGSAYLPAPGSSSPGWGVLVTSLDLLRLRDASSALEPWGPKGAARTAVRAGCGPSAPGSASFGHRPPGTPGGPGHALRAKPRPSLHPTPHPAQLRPGPHPPARATPKARNIALLLRRRGWEDRGGAADPERTRQ